ncbi:MAG TPA: Stp1/IreP family PP2C-type Ser/Thr phosphatase [Candidatus Onthovicinus excrementipullorum]|nr:Stp1/IreP family PP2C-type Ser/Thr phosphatase [Candidatus Onthovicinus excrementipullorum]
MRIVAKTDTGLVRSMNQDAYAAGELPVGAAWAVVCDGMGGASGGDVASSLAVKTISEHITSGYRDGMGAKSVRNMLDCAISAANITIYDMSRSNESLRGMGTTVVAVIVAGGTAYISHAGDSRAYMLSEGGELRQLTRDHSMVQELLECGKLTPEEARTHPRKNVITRALGVADSIDADFSEEKMEPGDVLLICTDGLSNYISNDDIVEVTKSHNYYEFADELIKKANSNGGGDNITVVAVTY